MDEREGERKERQDMNSQTIIQSTKNTIPNDDHVLPLFPFFLSTLLSSPLLSSFKCLLSQIEGEKKDPSFSMYHNQAMVCIIRKISGGFDYLKMEFDGILIAKSRSSSKRGGKT